jgi:tetratricopeptide (TPR) repeat protein
MRIATTTLLFLTLSCCLSAENLEKTQKKALEVQAKAIVAEAKSMEAAGQLADARIKYAESQAMLETKDAAEAIKHLDDEIHKRVKKTLSDSRKLYEQHKYKEAADSLEESGKLGASDGVLSSNLALCYFQLGDRNKAVESLDRAIRDTSDPKEKLKLRQLLTSFTTNENVSMGPGDQQIHIAQFNQLVESVGFDASLEDEQGAEDEGLFSEPDSPSPQLLSHTPGIPEQHASYSISKHRVSMCSALQAIKNSGAESPAAIFDRANCAEMNDRPAEAVQLLLKYLQSAPQALDADAVRARIADLQSLLALPEEKGSEIRRLYASASRYLMERKYDRALTAFTRARDLAPSFSLTYWRLGLLSEAMGRLDDARANFAQYQKLTIDAPARNETGMHLTTFDGKTAKYNDEVSDAEDILSDLLNRGMNLTFNLDANRSAIRARRAQIKKKEDRKKDKNRVGGFAIPYPYAQQELAKAAGHLQIALALFPLGVEANELMGLVFLQANDGRSATKTFDAVASQSLPVAFYAEMRGRKLDHAVKCELTRDRVRMIFLSSYDKKGSPAPPDKAAGDDGLGDLVLIPSDKRQPFDSLELNISDIKRVETNRGLLTLKLAKQDLTLAPIYLPSFTPVEGPPARRFANVYTRLFIRYSGLENSKLGAEGMTGGEKFAMGYKLATASLNIATGLNPIGAIQATQSAISIARIIHDATASLSVSFASWERNVSDQQELLAGPSFKVIPTMAPTLAFVQEMK